MNLKCKECGKERQADNAWEGWFKDFDANAIYSGECEDCKNKRLAGVFEEMIRDWQADGNGEYDDLVITEIEQDENGNWVAYCHDDKVTYQLSDDGAGNIIINYLGTR